MDSYGAFREASETCLPAQIIVDGKCQNCTNPGEVPQINRISCSPCNLNQVAINGVCETCPRGQVPFADRLSCFTCPKNQFTSNGSCLNCPTGTMMKVMVIKEKLSFFLISKTIWPLSIL